MPVTWSDEKLILLYCLSKSVIWKVSITDWRSTGISFLADFVPYLHVYVNDINRHVHLGSCNIYADDTINFPNATVSNILVSTLTMCYHGIFKLTALVRNLFL